MLGNNGEIEFMKVYGLYIYTNILLVKNYKSTYQYQVDIHSFNTQNKNDFTIKKVQQRKFKQSPT